MESLLKKVKVKMSIHAHQRVRGLLDGEYASVFKGRSIDFDDLRQYIPGDDVKDIDWKASARLQEILIKRYVAVRKHNVLLIVNTGNGMRAKSSEGEDKRDIAIFLAGVIAHIAQKHGDLVSSVTGDCETNHYLPLKANNYHLEMILRQIHNEIENGERIGDIKTQLEYVVRNIRRKMIVIIISDEHEIDSHHEDLLKRLKVLHEVLWLTVADFDIENAHDDLIDVESVSSLPKFLVDDPSVKEEFARAKSERVQSYLKKMGRLGIAHQVVESSNDAIAKIMKVLEIHKSARR